MRGHRARSKSWGHYKDDGDETRSGQGVLSPVEKPDYDRESDFGVMERSWLLRNGIFW